METRLFGGDTPLFTSSVARWRDTYFVTYADSKDKKLVLVAIQEPYKQGIPDPAKVRIRFEKTLGQFVGPVDWGAEYADLPLPSPVVGFNGAIIVATADGNLAAIDPATGEAMTALITGKPWHTIGTPLLTGDGFIHWFVANCDSSCSLVDGARISYVIVDARQVVLVPLKEIGEFKISDIVSVDGATTAFSPAVGVPALDVASLPKGLLGGIFASINKAKDVGQLFKYIFPNK